jgi:hypothetical protein
MDQAGAAAHRLRRKLLARIADTLALPGAFFARMFCVQLAALLTAQLNVGPKSA